MIVAFACSLLLLGYILTLAAVNGAVPGSSLFLRAGTAYMIVLVVATGAFLLGYSAH